MGQEVDSPFWSYTEWLGATPPALGDVNPTGPIGKPAKRVWSACICLCTLVCSLAPHRHSHTAYCTDNKNQQCLFEAQKGRLYPGVGVEYILICLCSLYSVSGNDTPAANTGPGCHYMCYWHIATSGTTSLAFLNDFPCILSNAVLVIH